MPELLKNRVRLVALLHPKEGMSFEEFSTYWRGTHSQLFASLPVVQRNLLKYEQFHFNPAVNKQLGEGGVFKSPYWGMAVFEAESYEKLMEVFGDPEYVERVIPDEERFFERKMVEMIAGDLSVIIDK